MPLSPLCLVQMGRQLGEAGPDALAGCPGRCTTLFSSCLGPPPEPLGTPEQVTSIHLALVEERVPLATQQTEA